MTWDFGWSGGEGERSRDAALLPLYQLLLTITYHTIPNYTIPNYTKPYHTIPNQTKPNQTTSKRDQIMDECNITTLYRLLFVIIHSYPWHNLPSKIFIVSFIPASFALSSKRVLPQNMSHIHQTVSIKVSPTKNVFVSLFFFWELSPKHSNPRSKCVPPSGVSHLQVSPTSNCVLPQSVSTSKGVLPHKCVLPPWLPSSLKHVKGQGSSCLPVSSPLHPCLALAQPKMSSLLNLHHPLLWHL